MLIQQEPAGASNNPIGAKKNFSYSVTNSKWNTYNKRKL